MLLEDMKSVILGFMPGAAIFLNDQPDEPDNVLTLYQTGGGDPSHSFDKRQFREPLFQIIARNEDPKTARDIMDTISANLDGKADLIISGRRYISVFQQSDVLPLGKDGRGRTELSLNFRTRMGVD